jgi:acyl-CoA reductase-like NAD-dependent aldehyde dehydrogenase
MKPSELAPVTAAVLADLVPKYLDPDCYAVVNGGELVVTELLKLEYDHILYTGGANVGKIVMRAAAEFLTPVTLELGGKSPVIVSKNADIKLAAKRVSWGKYACCGQTCVAPDYALVEESVHDEFLEALKEVALDFFEGNAAAQHKMGRIVNMRHWERVTGLLKRTKGNIVIGGGSDASTRFVEPTVVSDVKLDDPLMLEEIFGPILPIISVPSIAAACTLIPKISAKPLGLYIMSEDSSELDFVVQNTQSGGVSLNDVMTQIAVPNVPFGGVRASGMGSYHGKASIDTFSHRRSVVHVRKDMEEGFEWRFVTLFIFLSFTFPVIK